MDELKQSPTSLDDNTISYIYPPPQLITPTFPCLLDCILTTLPHFLPFPRLLDEGEDYPYPAY